MAEEVFEAFKKRKTILRSIKTTPVDYIVGHAALVFELEYEESRRIVSEQGYLWKLLDFQSENLKTRKIFEEMKHIMKEWLGG